MPINWAMQDDPAGPPISDTPVLPVLAPVYESGPLPDAEGGAAPLQGEACGLPALASRTPLITRQW